MSLYSSLKPIRKRCEMFGLCLECGTRESFDCPLYLCQSEKGFIIACCIVFAINHKLTILRRVDDMTDWEDGTMWDE